ncbi:hypothetical protein Fcan01_20974, partial [Folsomia candida]
MEFVPATKISSSFSSDFDLKRVLEDFKNARSIPQAKITQRFSMPDWIDVSLAKRGQKFARDNLFSICICHAFGLTTMPHPDLVNILLFTGRLSSPEGATKRYLSTFTEIMSWYDEGLWGSRLGSHPTDVFTSLKRVRTLHLKIAEAISNKFSRDGIILNASDYSDYTPVATWSSFHKDLEESNIPLSERGIHPNFEETSNFIPFNQHALNLAQFAFVGYPILFPERFGISRPSEDDLWAFNHLWAILGYVLGIEDKYNIALQPDLKSGLQTIAFPATPNFMLYRILRDVFDVTATNMWKCLTFREKLTSAFVDHILFPVLLKNQVTRNV